MKKKILIVSYKFPPINTMGSRRWAEMLVWLQNDYDIYVFTTNSEGDLDVPLPESRIIRFGFTDNNLFQTNKQKIGLLHRFIRMFTSNLRTIDSTFVSWFMKYRKNFLNTVNKISPDVIITTTVSIAPAMFGYWAKRKHPDILWINDLRDSMSLFNEHEKNRLAFIIDRAIDKHFLSKADLVFTVSDTLNNLMSELYKVPVFTIYNGFKAKQIDHLRKKNDPPILYYAGRIYKHREEAFRLLINAVQNMDVKLIVRLVGTKEQFDSYEQMLENNFQKNVEILKPADHKTIEIEEYQADILVLLEDLNDQNIVSKGTLTGKLFEYLNIPNPVLAICRQDSEIGDVLKMTGKGEIAITENEISEFINKSLKGSSSSFDQKSISNFSRRSQAKRVKEILEEYLEQPV